MEFKERLRLLRNEKDLPTTQLAARLEKSEGAIRMWETGKSKPDCDTLIKLAEYFDCTTDYLLGIDDFRNRKQQSGLVTVSNDIINSLSRLNADAQIEVVRGLHRILEYNGMIVPNMNDSFISSIVLFSERMAHDILDINMLIDKSEQKALEMLLYLMILSNIEMYETRSSIEITKFSIKLLEQLLDKIENEDILKIVNYELDKRKWQLQKPNSKNKDTKEGDTNVKT